jgi:adenylyltransferase/sulfurtransferase
MPLTEAQVQRYSRHILLPEVGGVGQERLLGASAAVAFSSEGGGTAAVAAVYLASAGVGRIGWCPPAGWGPSGSEETGSLAGLIGLYAPAGDAFSPSASIAALNPDSRLEVIADLPARAGDFDILLIPGESPALRAAAAAFEDKPVICGRRLGWAGAVSCDLEKMPPEEAEEALPAASPQGVLGAMLASAAIRALLEGKTTVGSTEQARFDLSRGLFTGAAL